MCGDTDLKKGVCKHDEEANAVGDICSVTYDKKTVNTQEQERENKARAEEEEEEEQRAVHEWVEHKQALSFTGAGKDAHLHRPAAA